MILKASFVVALASMLGGLYFGEVLKYPPCTLCWYQRICMYPLVVIFGAALWSDDTKNYLKTSLPLSGLGLLIAVYHNLLYYKLIPDTITPCSEGPSCTTVQVELLGFITIPLMALASFALLNVLAVFALKEKR